MSQLLLHQATPLDIERIQRILDAAPSYNRRTEGVDHVVDSGKMTLESIPDGLPRAQKHVFILAYEGKDIGIADVLEGYPNKGVAFLGLLLLVESMQGLGIGREAYLAIEERIRSFGCMTIRLAVVDSNPVEPFWEKFGFKRTGKAVPHRGQRLESVKRVMEKSLAALE